MHGNTPAPDPRSRFGVGDFDGDGRDDVLLATGQALYYSSGGATEWRYLNRSALPLSAFTFADCDGNGTTDISPASIPVVGLVERQFVVHDGQPAMFVGSGSYARDDVLGDFTGDGVPDRLHYDGDRYFRIVNGVSGVVSRSRYQM